MRIIVEKAPGSFDEKPSSHLHVNCGFTSTVSSRLLPGASRFKRACSRFLSDSSIVEEAKLEAQDLAFSLCGEAGFFLNLLYVFG